MLGKIVKGIAGFYYVHVVESGVYECKAKGIFRKEKIKPLVGDNVEMDVIDEKEKTGNIVRICPRKNELIRPAVANIDQALIVFAVTKPKPHLNLLDRFLIMMESKDIPVTPCFNKKDLAADEERRRVEGGLMRPACYPVVFTSALKEENITKIRRILEGKDNRSCRTIWSREVFSDQSSGTGRQYGNRGDQQKDRAGTAYDKAL